MAAVPYGVRLAVGQPTPGSGIIERVQIYTFLLWMAVFAWRLSHPPPRPSSASPAIDIDIQGMKAYGGRDSHAAFASAATRADCGMAKTEVRMKRLPLVVSLALIGGLVAAACSERTVAPGDEIANPDPRAILLAHSPAHHGASRSVSIASTPSYAGLDDAAAEQRGGSVGLMVDASGSIPRFPDEFLSSVAVFGYAWADLGTGRGIVAVIHPVIGRDSHQNPEGWHTHPVQLAGGTKPAGTSDFCIVSIGTSQGGIAIQGDVLRVQMSEHWAGVAASALDVAAAFKVQGDTGCAATGLGVVVLDAESL